MGRRVPQHSGKFAMKIKVMFGKTRQMTMIDVLAHRNIERMGLFSKSSVARTALCWRIWSRSCHLWMFGLSRSVQQEDHMIYLKLSGCNITVEID
jgi:hypothetical protein